MRFAHTVVSSHRFRDPTHNLRRHTLLRELLTRLAAERVAFVAIPAGYITVTTEDQVTLAAAEIADLVEACGVGVIGGVDVVHPKRGKADIETDELVREGRLPYFGFAAFPTSVTAEVLTWRQANTTSGNADHAPDEALPTAERVVAVGGTTVLPLLCGELYNRRIREALPGFGPSLVLDLRHSGMGQGLIPAMTSVANATGCPVAHTQHVWVGASHFVTAAGEQRSIPRDRLQHVGDDDFWIGWCVRDV